MAENIFQNQVRLDDTVYDLHPDQTMTFDLATNAAIDKPFDTISNEIWLDSIAWDAYFDGQMALSSVVDDFMEDDTSSSREHVWPDSIACESFLDNPMTSTAVGGDTFHVHNQDSPDHITCDSHVNDELLTVNLATETIKDDILDINYMVCDSNPDEPASREFQKWKEGWDEKMSLVRWKREGKGWDDITKAFQKLGVQKGSGGWKSMLVRAESEIDALGKAAAADREGEADRLGDLALRCPLGDIAWVDYDNAWARIAESMKKYGSERKWSSDRVKYAWNRGVSDLFPHIKLRQRKVFQVILM